MYQEGDEEEGRRVKAREELSGEERKLPEKLFQTSTEMKDGSCKEYLL